MIAINLAEVPQKIKEFADALDSELCRESLAKIDPMREKLTALLDATGKYATVLDVDNLRALKSWPANSIIGNRMPLARRLTDELRRFADVLQKKTDLIRVVDPGFKRLSCVLDAIRLWCGWLGIDLGLGGMVAANPVLFPNAKRRLLKGSKLCPGKGRRF